VRTVCSFINDQRMKQYEEDAGNEDEED